MELEYKSNKNIPGKDLEVLALKFANKAPKETNFNNTRTNKYFKNHKDEKGTLRSIETIKINYGTLKSHESEIVNENNIRLSIDKFKIINTQAQPLLKVIIITLIIFNLIFYLYVFLVS